MASLHQCASPVPGRGSLRAWRRRTGALIAGGGLLLLLRDAAVLLAELAGV